MKPRQSGRLGILAWVLRLIKTGGRIFLTTSICKPDFMWRESEGDYGTMTNRMIVKAEKFE
jgi:hypothetical protein